MRRKDPQKDTGLLSLRAAVILFLATLVAVVAGFLTYQDRHSLAAALLGAGAAWAGSVAVLERLIGP